METGQAVALPLRTKIIRRRLGFALILFTAAIASSFAEPALGRGSRNSRNRRPTQQARRAAVPRISSTVPSNPPAGTVPAAEAQVDQILTLVNGDIITRSDLLWSIAMDPQAPSPEGPISSDILRQKLDVMIDEKLITQEAARTPGVEVTKDEIDKARAGLISQFHSEDQFRRRIESVGLTPDTVDRILKDRLAIDKYIDFRFRNFVFVTDQEVKTYYDERLAPEIKHQNAEPPPLDQVRDKIVAILKQQRINDEIDRFLKEARGQADVIQLADL